MRRQGRWRRRTPASSTASGTHAPEALTQRERGRGGRPQGMAPLRQQQQQQALLPLLLLLPLLMLCGGVDGGIRHLTAAEQLRCAPYTKRVKDLGLRYTIATTLEGFSIAVHKATMTTNDIVSDMIVKYGFYEGTRTLDTFRYAVEVPRLPGAADCAEPPCAEHVLVDVGANIGWWTLSAAAKGWKVVAVEGAATNVAMLELSRCINPDLAPRIDIHANLVAEKPGVCAMAFPKQNVGDGQLYCELDGRAVEWTEADLKALVQSKESLEELHRLAFAVRVTMTRLDDVLDAAWGADRTLPRAPTLVKMDIEGSEFRALKGATAWLAQHRLPVIHTELWRALQGGSPVDYLNYMDGYLFKIAPAPCGNAAIPRGIFAHYVERMDAIEELCLTLDTDAVAAAAKHGRDGSGGGASAHVTPATRAVHGHRVGRRVHHEAVEADPTTRAPRPSLVGSATTKGVGEGGGKDEYLAQLQSLREELAVARVEVDAQRAEVRRLAAENDAAEIARIKNVHPNVRQEQYQKQVGALEAALDAHTREAADLESALDTQVRENSELRDELHRLRERVARRGCAEGAPADGVLAAAQTAMVFAVGYLAATAVRRRQLRGGGREE